MSQEISARHEKFARRETSVARSLRVVSLLSLIVLACAAHTHAQIQRTFVSTSGDDRNTAANCSRVAPCRGFAAAISVVATGGEVIALDSGGYGVVTITKAVQLISPSGVYAGITAASNDGVTINAPDATVVLRGLSINRQESGRQGTGQNGVNVEAVGALHVEGCTISGFTLHGLLFDVAGKLFIKDSIIRNNLFGINLDTSTGTIEATIDRLHLEGNTGTGLLAVGNSQVAIRDSVVADGGSGIAVNRNGSGTTATKLHIEDCLVTNNSGNGVVIIVQFGGNADVSIARSAFVNNTSHGIYVPTAHGGSAVVAVDDSRAVSNGLNGILASGSGATVRVSNTTITRNDTGVSVAEGASIRSFGDNKLAGNRTSDGAFTAPVITKQ